MTLDESKSQRMARVMRVLAGSANEHLADQALNQLWDEAFEAGRLAALEELQDRFCVCMK